MMGECLVKERYVFPGYFTIFPSHFCTTIKAQVLSTTIDNVTHQLQAMKPPSRYPSAHLIPIYTCSSSTSTDPKSPNSQHHRKVQYVMSANAFARPSLIADFLTQTHIQGFP